MRLALGVALFAMASMGSAQERIADYDNSVRLEYQYIRTGALDTTIGALDVGETDTHVLLLSGVYSFNERWKVYASLPWVQKRQTGNPFGVHNPVTDFDQFMPPDLRFIDDGDYHGGFQDLYVGVRYRAIDGPFFSLSPFIAYGSPLSNYPFYANAAIGRHLHELPMGVSLEITPYFSDWYFQADIAYVLSEKVLGVDNNYWLTYLSASYFVTPRFAPRVFLTSRYAPNALTFPDDFPDFDTEWWYHHDQTLKHNYVNAGIGFDYIVSDHYEISATTYRTVDPQQVEEVDFAFTFGVTRKF